MTVKATLVIIENLDRLEVTKLDILLLIILDVIR